MTADSLRICHYGTGKFADSPVIITLPKKMDGREQRVLVTYEFALSLLEAYDRATEDGKHAKFCREMEDFAYRFRIGDVLDAEERERGFMRWWQKEQWAAVLDFPRKKTVEEAIEDKLGYLAAAGEFTMGLRNGIYDTTWFDRERFFSWSRTRTSLGLIGAGATAAGVYYLTGHHDPGGLWFALAGLGVRFTRPFREQAQTASLFELQAYEMLPGTKEEKRELARAMKDGQTREETIRAVARALRRQELQAESERLASAISDELDEVQRLRELEAARIEAAKPPALLAALAEEEARAEHAEGWDLLVAQRQLLTELRSNRG